MKKLEYSAGAVCKGFWFQGFKKYNELLNKGFTDGEIKIKQNDENIFKAPSKSYGKRMVNEVSRRTKALPEEIRVLFSNLSISDQKILNILGLMLTDRLFFEFMYEVYREKIIVGNLVLDSSDIKVFLDDKSEQSTKVLNFTSQTKKRLAGAYRTYLREASLLIEDKELSKLRKPVLNIHLEEEMKKKDLVPFLRVFLGK